MNGADGGESATRVMTARLPGGAPVRGSDG